MHFIDGKNKLEREVKEKKIKILVSNAFSPELNCLFRRQDVATGLGHGKKRYNKS